MAYNKAKEEKKWRLWKEAEEKQLRSLGVSEDTIEQLHTHDWAVFNSDRRYYRRLQDAGTYLEEFAEETAQPEVKSVEDFLDNIENQQLYSVAEIQQILGISRPTAYNLIKRNGFQSIRTDKGIRVIKTSFDAWLNSNI